MKTLLLSHFFNCTLATRVRQTAGLLVVLAFFGFTPAYAQTGSNNNNRGIFEAFITVKIKSSNDIIYRLKDPNNTTSNSIYPDFVGTIGTFFGDESLIIRGGDTKTYKNSGCDITGSGLYYYVHPDGTSGQVPLRSYTRLDQPFFANLGNTPGYSNGDQQWGNANNPTNTINLLQGLTPNQSYIIEVFVAADVQSCNNGDNGINNMVYFSNNSRNYQITFTLLPSRGPLPVTLTLFDAKRQENNARLSWETASETNNRGYEVQVSTDSRNFRTLAFVPGQGEGTASGHRTYTYLDTESGKTGMRYYRLRQLDVSGEENFYGPQPVNFSKAGSQAVALSAYPNPFTGELNLQLGAQQLPRTGTVTLTDMMGRTVLNQPLTLEAGASQARLPELDKLPKGMYRLLVNLNGERQSMKLLKE